jgi:signal transduction histidine kinase
MKAFLDPYGKIVIQLSDNGQGILPEVMDKIFVPFFSTKPKGSGIGLSLSRQILRLHGGTLTARSEPDVETVFTLKF